jgi:hypothetical protein
MTFDEGADFGLSTGALAGSLQELQSLTSGFAGEIAGATEVMRAMDGQAQRLSRSLGTSLRTALDRAVFGGAKLSDVLRGLVSDFASQSLDVALRPVQSALGSGLSGLSSSLVSAFGFNRGGAFSAGRVRAFAQGGIVNTPTLFQMRDGMGLMGEAGPEAGHRGHGPAIRSVGDGEYQYTRHRSFPALAGADLGAVGTRGVARQQQIVRHGHELSRGSVSDRHLIRVDGRR